MDKTESLEVIVILKLSFKEPNLLFKDYSRLAFTMSA